MSPDAPVASNEPTTFNLLFVCTGNTCRSPLAEIVAAHAIASREWKHVRVASAGISAAPAAAASEGAIEVAHEHGLDLTGHTASQLAPEHLEWADLVLAMSPSHIVAIAEAGATGRVALLSDFADGEGRGRAIEDPFGGDTDTYRRAFEQIREGVEGLLARLEPILSP